jgi:hypothetical protein
VPGGKQKSSVREKELPAEKVRRQKLHAETMLQLSTIGLAVEVRSQKAMFKSRC